MRSLAGAAGALTAAAGAQGLYLQQQYRRLPEARGPLSGVALWRMQRRRSSSAAPADAAASSASGEALAPRRPGTVRGGGGGGGDRRSCRTILFIGDSLVTGVGCNPDGGDGPVLPRAVAEFVSRHTKTDVSWTALGETGGNIDTLHRKLLPRVAAEAGRRRALGQPIDVVVVVCGLNDFKNAYQGATKTATHFRAALSDFVAAIQSHAGVECAVVLPALPVHRAPVFGGVWPLQPFLEKLAGLWDEQKRSLAAENAAARARVESGVRATLRRIFFVGGEDDEIPEWWAAREYWAEDGIHPNDAGYRIWGEHIAESITRQLGLRISTDEWQALKRRAAPV